MKTELEKAIEAAIKGYDAVIAAAKKEAIEQFVADMAAKAGVPTKARALPRTPAPKAPRAARRQAAPTTPESNGDGKPTAGEAKPKAPSAPKRSEEELGALMDKLRACIEETPGQNVEVIGKALGIETSEARLPLKKLVDAGSIRVEGEKRATKYYPAMGAKAQAKPTNGAAHRVVVDESEEQRAEA